MLRYNLIQVKGVTISMKFISRKELKWLHTNTSMWETINRHMGAARKHIYDKLILNNNNLVFIMRLLTKNDQKRSTIRITKVQIYI